MLDLSRFHPQRIASLLACVVLALLATATTDARDARPRNLILLISDGCGSASFDLARDVAGHPLTLDSLRIGAVHTASATDSVTDSAASATAYTTGVRTVNRRLGRDPSGAPLTSWFTEAAHHGWATGIVVTTDITDATPAALYARAHDRAAQDSIAVQLLTLAPDVALGGGRAWFVPREAGGARTDGRDLVGEARSRGWRTIEHPADLDSDAVGHWLGLFANRSFDYRLDRDTTAQPDLATMARAAVRRLARSKHGFVLMVEGSLIDHAGHQNDPATHAREVLEYENMARGMLEFARRDGRTLVISLSDHETGGLQFAPPGSDSGLDVAVLRAQRVSAPRMAEGIGRGAGIDSVLALGWNPAVTVTPEERDRVASAKDDARRALAIAAIASRHAHVRWSTTGHTGQDIPLHAFGPGAEQFRGALDNAEVGRRIAMLLDQRSGYASAR